MPEHSNVECLGAGDCVPGVLGRASDPPEVVLRVAVRDPARAAVERFTKEFAPLVTSGPPGVTGYTTGRPPVREVFAYWPALIAQDASSTAGGAGLAGRSDHDRTLIRLGDIAHGRSGDKGNHANVAVIAYTPAGFAWLREHLTAEVVAAVLRAAAAVARGPLRGGQPAGPELRAVRRAGRRRQPVAAHRHAGQDAGPGPAADADRRAGRTSPPCDAAARRDRHERNLVLYEIAAAPAAVLTLNRADRRNALSRA